MPLNTTTVAISGYKYCMKGRMRLAREPGAGSGEQGKRERGAGIVVRNPEIDKFHQK
jgi:hypothetical protein